jgi:hypothetical protein
MEYGDAVETESSALHAGSGNLAPRSMGTATRTPHKTEALSVTGRVRPLDLASRLSLGAPRGRSKIDEADHLAPPP